MNTISKDHTGKTCKKRRSCKVCNERHLLTLHELKIERKSSGNRANIRANSQNSSKHNIVVVEDYDQNEEVYCNFTYTGSNVRVSTGVENMRGSSKFNGGQLESIHGGTWRSLK